MICNQAVTYRSVVNLSLGQYFVKRLLNNCNCEGDPDPSARNPKKRNHSILIRNIAKTGCEQNIKRKSEMIVKRVVYGGPELEIPSTSLSFGKYIIDKLKKNSADGDKIAMINGETHQQTSFSHLLRKTVDIANVLKSLALEPGDVVALYSENCSEYIAATVAAVSVGATVTTLNIKYTKDEIIHALNISKPMLIFCSEATVKAKLSILRQVPCIKYIVQLNGAVSAQDVLLLDAVQVLKSNVEDYEAEQVQCADDDTAFIFYSSGTTGLPKGVMLTNRNVLYGSAIFNYANKNNANVLTIVPWYHVYGLLTTIQYIVSGNLVVFLTELDHDKYLATIEKYRISEMPAVPPIIALLAKSPLVEKYDLSSVNLIWSAAAPLSADIIKNAKKNLPQCKGIFQAYGMTETSLAVMKEPENCNGLLRKEGSCGIPLPGITAKVVDIKTREKLGPNQKGEICIKGPTTMKGYVGQEAASKEMFDEEGYIKTGDMGYYDNDSYFYIVDRFKEIMKYKGQQVSPAVVESVVMEHNEVAECGVVGAPDELAGELPTAFVVKKPGSSLTEQELLDFTASKLSPASRLRGGVIFIQEIPKNSSGKILRRELRNKLREINGLR